jgi:hypothetical protein
MKLSKVTIAIYLGLVFASGIVLGIFGDRLYNASPVLSLNGKAPKPNPEEFRKKMVAEYQGRLKLTDQQIQQLNIILDETRSRFHEAHQKMDPELTAIQHEQRDKIRQMLKPEQRDEYERMLQEREKRQKEHGERRGGPGI